MSMNRFNQLYKKVLEDVTAAGAFGSGAVSSTGGQFPANQDNTYAPGDARVPSFIGAKKIKGKKKKPIIQRR
jgi:hypothetical protein